MAVIRIIVRLHRAILDPQGKAIEGALKNLGIEGIISIRQGKLYFIELEADDPLALGRRIAEEALVNPVMEEYVVELLDDVEKRDVGGSETMQSDGGMDSDS